MLQDDEYEPCFSDDEKEKQYYASKRNKKPSRKRSHEVSENVAQRGSNRGRALYNRGRGQHPRGNFQNQHQNHPRDYYWNQLPSYGGPPTQRGNFRGRRSHWHQNPFQQRGRGTAPAQNQNRGRQSGPSPFAPTSIPSAPFPSTSTPPNQPPVNSSNPYAEFGCYSTPSLGKFIDRRYQGN
ncbi:hypothetical protein WR25_03505 [Diploscapter pachys]|uniref:Uncharacterized protein n=1 Tax=Diploscapter pachys TaxID=2018661 RepID=A0A2A2KEJ5_9BILA|nr:hypothetical protein WR25_03505 [Diploscapter pachys]